MTPEQAVQLLKCLGAKQIEETPSGGWIRCSCVLARWTHQKGTDSNPSFGLHIGDGGERPHFNCYACLHGGLEELVQTLEMYVSQTPAVKHLYNFKQAHELLDSQELILALPEFSEFPQPDSRIFQPWPEPWVQSFMSVTKVPLAMEYMTREKTHLNQFGQKCRAFPLEVVQHFDLRYDHKGMVCFPYRDVYGRLAGMRGRSITDKSHHDYTWNKVNNAYSTWFNEQALDLPGWVVVVEGQMDAMRVWMGYPKVVAALTAKAPVKKMEKLLSAEGTILIPDNDDTGETTVEYYRKFHVKHKQPFRVLKLPDGVKDSDDCHHEYLRDRIKETI